MHCNEAQDLKGDAFTHFNTLVHILSHTFHTPLTQFFHTFHTIWNFFTNLCQFKHALFQKTYPEERDFMDTFSHFHTLIHTFSNNLNTIFTQFWLFLPNLSQFKHVWCLKTYNAAQDFNGDAFIQYNTNTILKTKLTNPKRAPAMVWIPGSTDA